VLAHELSGPLTAIAGWANALHEGAIGDGEEQRQALAWIEKSALAQQTFVAELAELGEVDGEPEGEGAEVVDLTETFRKTLVTLPAGSERERLVLRAPPAETAVMVRANPARLDRALELLVRRALDGTPADAGALRARVWVDAGEAAIDIDVPESSGVPTGWEVRVALATRIAEACGARLLLSESAPSVRLRFPRVGG
jgi:signal transduction histidine kinase